jgi:hypothetical protein
MKQMLQEQNNTKKEQKKIPLLCLTYQRREGKNLNLAHACPSRQC